MSKKGFTLIELLIVVAIIAILAAIAVPNFLEAQTRSKISRVKNDLRTLSTGLEAYFVDYNRYTRDNDSDLDVMDGGALPYSSRANGATQLTTPVAYLTSMLQDPFGVGQSTQSSGGVAIGYRIGSGSWSYATGAVPTNDTQSADAVFAAFGSASSFVIISPGPDQSRNRMGYKCFPYKSPDAKETGFYEDYDPSNGTISGGDIYRFGGSFLSGTWNRNADNAGPSGPQAN